MEAQDSTYDYTPLDETKREIRILRLFPKRQKRDSTESPCLLDADDGVIRCTFSFASLNNPPPFEALSYVWGDPKSVAPINLDGHKFLVTLNLHCALRHLRQEDEERVIWIDAICIDQANNSERTHQVAEMQSIYSLASTVVVFLGEAWEGSNIALDVLEKIGSDAYLHFDPDVDPHVVSHDLDFGSSALRSYLGRLLALPWFSRIWTIQEYVLAQHLTIQCGFDCIDGSLLTEFFYHVASHGLACCDQIRYILYLKGYNGAPLWSSLEGISMLKLLRDRPRRNGMDVTKLVALCRNRNSYDPRDMIYGVLGLAEGMHKGSIHPDYELTVRETYINAVAASIRDTQTLDILSYGHGERNPTLDLPSYVPDWTSTHDAAYVAAFDFRVGIVRRDAYAAHGGSQPELGITATGKAATRCIVLDAIAETKVYDGDNVVTDSVEAMRKVARIDREVPGPYTSRETAFWKLLCGGVITRDGDPERVTDADVAVYEQWRDLQVNVPPGRFWTDASPDVQNFMNSFAATTAGRAMFITDTGYIGQGPAAAEKGDVVVLLPGGKVPYVLRAVPEVHEAAPITGDEGIEEHASPRYYTFLGDAYVQGVMQGDAYDEAKLEHVILV